MRDTVTFRKEMAISHRDFVRTLGRALGLQNLTDDDGIITVVEGDRMLEITLSTERKRQIALVSLPVTDVKFCYTGYDEPEKHLAILERSFQRGGG